MKTMENIIHNSHRADKKLNPGLAESDEGMLAAHRHLHQGVTAMSVRSRGFKSDPAI
jgi:hypothetical protein